MFKLLTLVLLLTVQLKIVAQGVSKLLLTPEYYTSTALKIVKANEGHKIIFGTYCDSNFRNNSGCYPLAYIYSLSSNKFTSLNADSTYFSNYGSYNFYDNILNIEDSLFVYHYTKQQIGKEYKYWENWCVIFNSNGDTIRTFQIPCTPLFGIENWTYDDSSRSIIVFGPDSAVYGLHNLAPLKIYQFDLFGNKLWEQKYSSEFGCLLTSISVSNSRKVTLSGSININIDMHDGQRHLFTKFHSLQLSIHTGQILTSKIITDSIGQLESRSITNCSSLDNEKVVALSYPKSLFWPSTLTSYEYWTELPKLQEVILFDSSFHLLKSRNIYNLKEGNELKTIYTYLKQVNDRNIVLLGASVDSLINNPGSQYKAHLASVITMLNQNLDLVWSRNYSFDESKYNNSYLVDIIETSGSKGKGYILIGSTIETARMLYRTWYVATDSLGCIEPGCQKVGLSEIINPDNADEYTIFPNPVNSVLNVIVNGYKSNILLEGNIFNANGNLVKTFSGNKNKDGVYKLNVDQLTPGIYYIMLKKFDDKYVVKMFIK